MLANKSRFIKFSFSIILLVLTSKISIAQNLEFKEFELGKVSGKVLKIPNSYRINILASAPFVLNSNSSAGGLDALVRLVGEDNSEVALIAGGVSNIEPFSPAGALIIKGESYSPFSKSARQNFERQREGSYELTGVLCISSIGEVSILKIDRLSNNRRECFSALQAGPIVTVGKNPIKPEPDFGENRVVACVPRIDRASYLHIYYLNNASLLDAEISLQVPCKEAINIVAGKQAGMGIWRNGRLKEKVGEVLSPIPAIFLIKEK